MSAPLVTGDVVPATVKSKFASKTNITSVLLLIFGVLTATGKLPAAVSNPEAIGGVVAAGAVLVAWFRTTARSLLA